MIFKCFIHCANKQHDHITLCKVIAIQADYQIEDRIGAIISNLKADGFDDVQLQDCFNITEPCRER